MNFEKKFESNNEIEKKLSKLKNKKKQKYQN